MLSTFPSSFCCESDIMQISLILAQQIAELFLILLIGCVLVKVRLLKSADSRVLSVVMVYAVMPCVIINAFQVDYSPAVVTGLLYAFALAIALHALLLLLFLQLQEFPETCPDQRLHSRCRRRQQQSR